MKLPEVDRTQPQSNMFATVCVWRMRLVTGDSKLIESPELCLCNCERLTKNCFVVYGTKLSHVVFNVRLDIIN